MYELTSNSLLADVLSVDDPHNTAARILRRGIVVSAFSCMENYFEARLKEVLGELQLCSFGYRDFSQPLKEFFTQQALVGLTNRLKFQDSSDRQLYAELGISALARYGETTPIFSGFGFSPIGSNVNQSDVAALFKAFGVRNAWEQLTAIAREVGSTLLKLDDVYAQLSKIRNKAAHDSAWNIPINDLSSRVLEIIYIGICFDVLLSFIVSQYRRGSSHASVLAVLARPNPKLYFVDELPDGSWGNGPEPEPEW